MEMLKTIILLIAYSISLIIAGHGIGPVGLLLLRGDFSVWGPAQIVGGVSVISLLAITLSATKQPDMITVIFRHLSLLGLYASWILFVYTAAESSYSWRFIATHLVLSLPFQLVWIYYLYRLVYEYRLRRTSSK